MVPPSQKPARLEAASFIISAVEGKHFSLAQLIYAEPKRRRAAYLIDESKTMIEILKLDIDADGQAAWGKLLRRVEGLKAGVAAEYLYEAKCLWKYTVKIATRIFERYKFDIRPTSQVNRRPVFCKRAAPARKPLRPPVVAPRRAQEYPAQGSWPMPVPVPRPLWPDLPAHHQPVLDAPGVAWVPVFIQTSPAWPSSPWPQYW